MDHFSSFEQEVAGIAAYLKTAAAEDGGLASCCLVTRTVKALDEYEAALAKRGVATYRVRRSEAEDRRAGGLRLATMHRVKGLEFDRVVIAGVNRGVVPLETAGASDDPVVLRERELAERALLYVAATRARKEVLVTCSGPPSSFLASARHTPRGS